MPTGPPGRDSSAAIRACGPVLTCCRPGASTSPSFGSWHWTIRAGTTAPSCGLRWLQRHPLEIEIGYGRGDFLLDRARRHPERTLPRLRDQDQGHPPAPAPDPAAQLQNLWVSDDDARFNLPRVVPDGRVDACHVLFPDPWWKTQHRVKRLFSPPFVELVAAKLRPGGLLYFKSDVEEYGELVRYLVEPRRLRPPRSRPGRTTR